MNSNWTFIISGKIRGTKNMLCEWIVKPLKLSAIDHKYEHSASSIFPVKHALPQEVNQLGADINNHQPGKEKLNIRARWYWDIPHLNYNFK